MAPTYFCHPSWVLCLVPAGCKTRFHDFLSLHWPAKIYVKSNLRRVRDWLYIFLSIWGCESHYVDFTGYNSSQVQVIRTRVTDDGTGKERGLLEGLVHLQNVLPQYRPGVPYVELRCKFTCYMYDFQSKYSSFNLYPTNAPSPFKSASIERTKSFKCPVRSCNVEA